MWWRIKPLIEINRVNNNIVIETYVNKVIKNASE